MSHMKECKAPVLLCAGVVTLLPSAHVADGFSWLDGMQLSPPSRPKDTSPECSRVCWRRRRRCVHAAAGCEACKWKA